MSFVLKIFQRRDSLLLVWWMSYAFVWTNRENQEENWPGHTGERRGPKQWQHDHWKAKDAAEGAKKRDYKSIEHRRLTDPAYQESQLSHGWTLTASTSTTSKPSTWTTLLLGEKEIGTRTCSYCGFKTERTLERCQFEMISNLQPDHLLWPATRKVKYGPTFLEVDDFDSDHWMHNLKQTWNGGVCTIKRYMVRRRHLLHLRQLGGQTDNGIGGSQQNGTNHTMKIGTVKFAGKSKRYRLFQAMEICLTDFAYRQQRCLCKRREGRHNWVLEEPRSENQGVRTFVLREHVPGNQTNCPRKRHGTDTQRKNGGQMTCCTIFNQQGYFH